MMTSSFIDIANPQDIAKHVNETQIAYFKEHIGTLIDIHQEDKEHLKEVCGDAINVEKINQEDFINGGFIESFGDSLYQEKQDLILKLCNESKHIKLGFAYFSLMSTQNRTNFAINSTNLQRKAGWEYAGYEYPFGKLDNQLSLSRDMIAASVFPSTATQMHPYPYSSISDTITGILTNNNAIPEDEKNTISNIAFFLITSEDAAAIEIQSPYNMQNGRRDECHDLEYIETAIEALYIAENDAEKNSDTIGETAVSKDLQPFWNNTDRSLITDQAQSYLTVLKELNELNVPLPLPDNLMEYVQRQVLERGAHGATFTHDG